MKCITRFCYRIFKPDALKCNVNEHVTSVGCARFCTFYQAQQSYRNRYREGARVVVVDKYALLEVQLKAYKSSNYF